MDKSEGIRVSEQTHIERQRSKPLWKAEINDLVTELLARQTDAAVLKALAKLRHIFLMAAERKPSHAGGLIAAKNITDMFALQYGEVPQDATTFASLIRNSDPEEVGVPDRVVETEKLFQPPRAKSSPKPRDEGGVVRSKMGQIISKVMEMNGVITIKRIEVEVARPLGLSKTDSANGLYRLVSIGKLTRIGVGEYKVTGTESGRPVPDEIPLANMV